MQNKAFSKILVLIILAVLVGGGLFVYQYWWLPKEEAKNHAISEAKIKEISIQKPNLVITGENLSEVQVYIVPTGTGIDRETMSLIENATKQSENNGEQIWTYQYPENLLITNIFVKGFDNNGNFVGKIDLPIVGATALWDALYGNTDETADWQIYKDENVTFKFPSGWTEEPILIRGSGYTKEFKDLENKFSFTFLNNGNYNQVTGKPYENIDEYINMPYQVKTVIVDGQEGRQPLPRAGSENINSAVFFSKDLKFIYTLMLKTGNTPLDTPVNDINEGQELFNQILSTFRFIEDETTNWEIFTDNEVGYSLKYPPYLKKKQLDVGELKENITRIVLPIAFAAGLPPNIWNFESDYLVLSIDRQKIDEITDGFPPSLPGYTKEVILQDKEYLENGEFGYSPAFSLKESQKVVMINGKIYGKEFTILGMFEVCNVLPTRTLIFLKNGYKVNVILQAWAVSKIQSELPQYFTINKENCGSSLIWNFSAGSQSQFYNDLANGVIDFDTEAGIWYNTFDKIVSTIDFFDSSSSKD